MSPAFLLVVIAAIAPGATAGYVAPAATTVEVNAHGRPLVLAKGGQDVSEPADTTEQPTELVHADTTEQPTELAAQADTTEQPTELAQADTTEQPTELVQADTTEQPTELAQADTTTQLETADLVAEVKHERRSAPQIGAPAPAPSPRLVAVNSALVKVQNLIDFVKNITDQADSMIKKDGYLGKDVNDSLSHVGLNKKLFKDGMDMVPSQDRLLLKVKELEAVSLALEAPLTTLGV